jgi:hypothetical protein
MEELSAVVWLECACCVQTEELLWLMVHARASYGFAQHAGDISSVATAAAALTVKKFYFDITTGVDAASNTVRVPPTLSRPKSPNPS